MNIQFRDRSEAGRVLGQKLARSGRYPDATVLGLPRGGMLVAAELARTLQLPLDVLTVRKLYVPARENVVCGAIANGGVRVLDAEVVKKLQLEDPAINTATERARQELVRCEHVYHDDRPGPDFRVNMVILVDDFIATGSKIRAAIAAVRQHNVSRIVVAVPVVAARIARQLYSEVHELFTILTPPNCPRIDDWYEDAHRVSDEEVRSSLHGLSLAT